MTDSIVVQQIPWKPALRYWGIVLFAGLVALLLELFGQPTKRGFFCNDDTINYPLTENTISDKVLVLCAILLPLFIICPTQLWTYGSCARKAHFWKLPIPKWLRTSSVIYGAYLIGLFLGLIVAYIGKFTIGRLRPNFLAVCHLEIPCSELPDQHKYITEYNCTGPKNDVLEARLSFPSAHSSVAFYACIYLTVYLQLASKWRNYGAIRGSMQFILISTAWWVSLTRVMDNWHHWSDVLVGIILGCGSVFLAIKYLPGLQGVSSEPSGDHFLPLKKAHSTPQISSETS